MMMGRIVVPLCYPFNSRKVYSSSAHWKPRLRFAPSPTGNLHLGSLRTVLYNYLYAKKLKGHLILRIEDTDQTRVVEGATEKLQEILDWAGIRFDESPLKGGSYGPYIQSKRIVLYHQYAEQLLQAGHAYKCYCTKEMLESRKLAEAPFGNRYDRRCRTLSPSQLESYKASNTPYVVRVKIPPPSVIVYKDIVFRKSSSPTYELDDAVMMKSDGWPTYHFANVIDDHLMEITHVLRGQEWIPSTPLHVILYQLFGWTPPIFAHLPLLLNKDGSKLSKRQNDAYVEYYKDNGYLPEALVNFVAFLGWTPKKTIELLSLSELIDEFSLERVHTSSAIVSTPKLDWFNKHYIKKLFNDDGDNGMKTLIAQLRLALESYSTKFKVKWGDDIRITDEYLKQCIHLLKDRVNIIHQIPLLAPYLFGDPLYDSTESIQFFEESVKQKDNRFQEFGVVLEELQAALSALANEPTLLLEEIDVEIKKAKNNLVKKFPNYSSKTIFLLFRYIVTGTHIGASVVETIHVLGKRVCLKRVEYCIKKYQLECTTLS